MLPLSDGVPARRFPVVTVLLIAANFAVWLLYELPNLNGAIFHASFYPCTIDGACHGPEPWGLSWITAMFLHGGWDHILLRRVPVPCPDGLVLIAQHGSGSLCRRMYVARSRPP